MGEPQFENSFIYNPFITAISRRKMSAPLDFLLKNNHFENIKTVLDFGAGRMMDVLELNKIGIKCKAYDKYADYYSPSDELLLQNEYDLIMSNYVFNTIQTKKDHYKTLKIFRKIKSKRKIISIRNDFNAIKKEWIYNESNECFFTGKSFQRFFNIKTLNRWFGNHVILEKKSNYLILELL